MAGKVSTEREWALLTQEVAPTPICGRRPIAMRCDRGACAVAQSRIKCALVETQAYGSSTTVGRERILGSSGRHDDLTRRSASILAPTPQISVAEASKSRCHTARVACLLASKEQKPVASGLATTVAAEQSVEIVGDSQVLGPVPVAAHNVRRSSERGECKLKIVCLHGFAHGGSRPTELGHVSALGGVRALELRLNRVNFVQVCQDSSDRWSDCSDRRRGAGRPD